MTDSEHSQPTQSTAIVPTRAALDIAVPAPGAMFKVRTISPRNLQLKQQHEHARILSRREHKHLKRKLVDLQKILQRDGYDTLVLKRDSYEQKITRIMAHIAAHGDNPKLERRAHLLYHARNILTRKIETYGEVVRAITDIQNSLHEHEIAVRREKEFKKQRKALKQEAYDWQDIVKAVWSRLGYREIKTIGKREVIRLPRFAETHILPDQVWLQIHTTNKKIVGLDNALPHKVKVQDLISDETIEEISIACRRQVMGMKSYKSGAWVVINRLDTADGILEYVSYSQVMARYDHANHPRIPIPLGVTEGRRINWIPFADFPHYLIAGTTGTGKSNMAKVILTTVIAKHAPQDVQIIIVDMKEGSETAYISDSGIPHLAIPTVTTAAAFGDVLAQLETLRIERSHLFRSKYAVNIDDYNARVNPAERIPRVLVLVDEFARVHHNNPYADARENKAIAQRATSLVRQLLAMGRSAGIHLIICTQTPYVEVISGMDKANISVRMSGALATYAASRTVFDTGQAAKLPMDIRGRMFAQIGASTFQIQTPHITHEDLKDAILIAKTYGETSDFTLPHVDAQGYSFDLNDILEIALDEYGGRLTARKMWDGTIRHLNVVSFREFDSMVKQILDSEQVEYEGKVFTWESLYGGGKRLVLA